MKKKFKLALVLFLLLLLLLVIASFAGIMVYAGGYYEAEAQIIEAMSMEPGITRGEHKESGRIEYHPDGAEAGLIFYPGGKVEHRAYEPLMLALAERGISTVLFAMPLKLAVLDMDAAAQLPGDFLEIDKWYIGGHSLGGAMAASYAAGETGRYEGLILLGAYSTANIRESGMKVLSIYGSEDGVMDREKYNECMLNLPEDAEELIINGGNHAGFGYYGEQEGDGEALIPAEEQIEQAADAIAEFIMGGFSVEN